MQIESFAIEGFRSLRNVVGKLGRANVVVGPNGVGKSNLYRAFELLHLATDRQLARAVANEGGMKSVRWAGDRGRNQPIRIRIHIVWDSMEYELVLGEESPDSQRAVPFPQDPYIKTEKIWMREPGRVEMIRRGGPKLVHRDREGGWQEYPTMLACNESMLCQLREPNRFPEILAVRQAIAEWRFYHTFRTDPDSPLRKPQVAFRTMTLDADGGNLAAMVMTIQASKSRQEFASIIQKALPKVRVKIAGRSDQPLREVGVMTPGMDRVWVGKEISDGTLRIVALAAAMLSDYPPELLVLNEPETSLHSSTFPALAELIDLAAQRSQLLVVTHSRELADAIAELRSTNLRTLRYAAKRGTELDTQVVVTEGRSSDA